MKAFRTLVINDKKYIVKFVPDTAIHPRLNTWRRVTICSIVRDGKTAPMAQGIAYRKPTDPFDEVEARTVSFKKAVETLAGDLRSKLTNETVERTRNAFLQAFFTKKQARVKEQAQVLGQQ